jgi:D-3-phosphoglycerate dehydrogenase / 2-oxoglutarate reductase
MSWNVCITDLDLAHTDHERAELARIDASLTRFQCRTEDEVVQFCRDADALLVQWAPITRHVIESLPRLKAISRYGIGYDMIDIRAAADRGIPVSNVPHYCTEEVATHAYALLLAAARKLVPLAASVQSGSWSVLDVAQPVRRLRNQVLGLAGGGRIGRQLAHMAVATGMRVQVFDPYLTISPSDGTTLVGWDELVETSDYISIHCPLTEETAGLFNAAAFRRMKPSAVLINTSRGGIVDTPALIGALQRGAIAGAAIDVVAHEPPRPGDIPTDLANLIVTPHAAWYSEEALADLQRLAARAIVEIFKTGTTESIVNLPLTPVAG